MADSKRRAFLKHTALTAALGPPAMAAASPVAEGATRIGLIDCQSHLFCEDMLAMMERRSSDPVAFVKDDVRMAKTGDWLRKVPPLQDMQASLVELDRCVDDLGMKGVLLYPNLAPKLIRGAFDAVDMPADDREKISSLNAKKLFQL